MTSERIISPRQRVLRESYRRYFEWKSTPGAGFSFPSDKDGNIQIVNLNDAAKKNYEMCLINKDGMLIDKGVEDGSSYYTEYAILKCKCNRQVVLCDYFHGNDCECGRIWSVDGYEYNPRSQWEDRMDDDDYHTVAEYNGGYDG